MNCAWDMFLNLVPLRMRQNVDEYKSEMVEEFRLRLGQAPEIVLQRGSVWLEQTVSKEDLNFSVNIASRYSPWSAATASKGYITAAGGHRVGVCGQAVTDCERITGIRSVTSICIRVARDMVGIAGKLTQYQGSILILGCPGSGKTTLLRDLVRALSYRTNVAVVDEREELYPICNGVPCFSISKKTDILSGCSKRQGIDIVLRTMRPEYIAVDEITAQEDCEGLVYAGWCGVKLLATAHADSKEDLLRRPVYKPIVESGLFENLIILQRDKSWYMERISV